MKNATFYIIMVLAALVSGVALHDSIELRKIADVEMREAAADRITQSLAILAADALREIALASQGRGDTNRVAALRVRAERLAAEAKFYGKGY